MLNRIRTFLRSSFTASIIFSLFCSMSCFRPRSWLNTNFFLSYSISCWWVTQAWRTWLTSYWTYTYIWSLEIPTYILCTCPRLYMLPSSCLTHCKKTHIQSKVKHIDNIVYHFMQVLWIAHHYINYKAELTVGTSSGFSLSKEREAAAVEAIFFC